jgi:hypothetical protein
MYRIGHKFTFLRFRRNHRGRYVSEGMCYVYTCEISWFNINFAPFSEPCSDIPCQWRTQEFLRGVQQIQLRTEGRENGDLGAVAPSQGFHSICKRMKPIFWLGCYGCIFHGTGNSAQLCQSFGISVRHFHVGFLLHQALSEAKLYCVLNLHVNFLRYIHHAVFEHPVTCVFYTPIEKWSPHNETKVLKFIFWVSDTFLRMWVVTPDASVHIRYIYYWCPPFILYHFSWFVRFQSHINYSIQVFLFIILSPAPVLNLALFFSAGFAPPPHTF